MALNDAQRDALQVTAARQQAEHLLAEMQRVFENARGEAESAGEMTDEQRRAGEQALQQAMESTRRMLDSLNAAAQLAQNAAERGGWDNAE